MRFSPRSVFVLLLLVLALPAWIFAASDDARIISLVPENTRFIHGLGFGNSLVGISDSCDAPADMPLIPRVGGPELNLEKIAGLKPTLILDLNGVHKRYELLFGQLSLKYVNIDITRVEDIPSAAVRIAHNLRAPEKATAFCADWHLEYSRLSSAHTHPKPRVYIETWDAPLQSATPESFIGQLVRLAGGENIFRDPSTAFPVVTSEKIIAENPEVILITYPLDDVARIGSRPGWADIDAVRRKRVFRLDDESVLRPGPMALKTILPLSNMILGK